MQFFPCFWVTKITIPDTITRIGSPRPLTTKPSITTFLNIQHFENIEVDPNNNVYSSDNGVLLDKNRTTIFCCPRRKKEYVIPDTVTSIRGYAFTYSDITTLTLPRNITEICESAFSSSKLKNIVISDNVTTIAPVTFGHCKSLESIVLPKGLTEIKVNAFKECNSLTDVYYSGTEAEWNAIEIAANNESLTKATIHCSDATISPIPSPRPRFSIDYIRSERSNIKAMFNVDPSGNIPDIPISDMPKIIFALYDNNGGLLDIQTADVDANAITPPIQTFNFNVDTEYQTDACTVKLFLWNSFDDTIPLSNAIEFAY